MAKDFSSVNTSRVYDVIATATAGETQENLETQETQKKQKARKVYSEAEALEFMQKFKTAGRKGVKMPRINLAFAPDNYEYVRTMAQVRGESLTDFVNHVLHKSMVDNEEVYKKAVEFKNSI